MKGWSIERISALLGLMLAALSLYAWYRRGFKV